MRNELHAFTGDHAYLEEPSGFVGSDQHDEVVQLEDSDGVAIGVEHVSITDPVFAGACQDHRIHAINLA